MKEWEEEGMGKEGRNEGMREEEGRRETEKEGREKWRIDRKERMNI